MTFLREGLLFSLAEVLKPQWLPSFWRLFAFSFLGSVQQYSHPWAYLLHPHSSKFYFWLICFFVKPGRIGLNYNNTFFYLSWSHSLFIQWAFIQSPGYYFLHMELICDVLNPKLPSGILGTTMLFLLQIKNDDVSPMSWEPSYYVIDHLKTVKTKCRAGQTSHTYVYTLSIFFLKEFVVHSICHSGWPMLGRTAEYQPFLHLVID